MKAYEGDYNFSTKVEDIAGTLFTLLMNGEGLTSRQLSDMDRRQLQKDGIRAVFTAGQGLVADLLSAARAMDWDGPEEVALINRLLSEEKMLYKFLRVQYVISRCFQQGRLLLEALYNSAEEEGVDTKSKAFKQMKEDVPEYARKSKQAFLLLPCVGYHATFIEVTRTTMPLVFKVAFPFVGTDLYRENPLYNTAFWWTSMLVVHGNSFQACQSRRLTRRKLRRLSGVMTHIEKWERYLLTGGSDECPWLIQNFSTDGRSLSILVKRLEKSTGDGDDDADHRRGIPGHAESYKREYRSCPTLEFTGDVSELTEGLYREIERVEAESDSDCDTSDGSDCDTSDGSDCDTSDCDTSDSDSVSEISADDNRINRPLTAMTIDPGKINTLSWGLFKVHEDFTYDKLEQGYVPKEFYETWIPQYHTLNRYELRRRSVNQAYQDAIEGLKKFRKRTVSLTEFEAYAHASIAAYNIIQAENIREEKLTLKFRIGIQRQQAIDKLARELVTSFGPVDVIFFGRSSIRHSRGHAPCATKDLIRAFSRICCVIAIDEYGTSSRCHACFRAGRPTTKLRRETLEYEASPVPIPMRGASGQQLRFSSRTTSDTRWERCPRAVCAALYPHDEIPQYSFLEIGIALLQGRPRPSYLRRGRGEAAVHAIQEQGQGE